MNPASAEQLERLIGRICVQFGALEFFLAAYCSNMLSDDQNCGFIVTSECSFGRLVAMYKSMVFYRTDDEALRTRTDALAGRLMQAEQQRNTALHSLWMLSEPADLAPFVRLKVTAKQRRGLDTQWQNTSVEDLEQTVTLVLNVRQELIDFTCDELVPAGVTQMSKKGLMGPRSTTRK